MHQTKNSKPFRIACICGAGIIALTGAYFLYLLAIVELAGKDRPPAWSPILGDMTFEEIHKKLGPPQDDAPHMQFQNWIEYHWWGKKLLKVMAGDCCKPSVLPSAITYTVYANGKYAPVYNQTLYRAHDVSEDRPYDLPAQELSLLMAESAKGNCHSSFRVAQYHLYASLDMQQAENYYRLAARCPIANAFAGLIAVLRKPEHDAEIDELVVSLTTLDTKQGESAAMEIRLRRAARKSNW